jgi:succinate dehydrogenase / fumarate reductase, flavoprotein subunit
LTGLRQLGTVLSTDVLIIGGGIGGITAAISAKEASPDVDVLIVEKNTSGWAGQANKGHGHFGYLDHENSPDEFVEFHVRNVGMFLEDQEMLAESARESRATVERFDGWGASLCRDDEGGFAHVPFKPGMPWSMAAADLTLLFPIHRRAKKLGVKFLDKVVIVDLLKDGDRVVGGIGFSALDGTCHIVKAKATIIATGGQGFRILGLWSCMRGDGAAAAYRAGAEMRSAEFGPYLQFANKRSKLPIMGAQEALYNAKGENISKRFVVEGEPDISPMAAVVWYEEMKAGNGPIYTRHAENSFLQNAAMVGEHTIWKRPFHDRFHDKLKAKAVAVDGRGEEAEVFPGCVGELSPIRVDRCMATSVSGLYAIGAASYTGSAMPGAVPAPPGRWHGSGLFGTTWMGMRVGPHAAAYAAAADEVLIDAGQAEALKERFSAPSRRVAGIHPLDLVKAIQAAFNPIGYSVYKSQERMEEALGMIHEVKEKLGRLAAADPHHLVACNEVASMVLSAELFYRASLERKESRGWHLREDYPQRDDSNWLKWIVLKEKNGEMALSTEDVPLERYTVRP